MSFVNFTSQFSQRFLYKFAVFTIVKRIWTTKTHSHRNSFRLNLFSRAVVASEIAMKTDQLPITNCKIISFRTVDVVKYIVKNNRSCDHAIRLQECLGISPAHD